MKRKSWLGLVMAERLSVLASTRYAQGRPEEGMKAIREAILLQGCPISVPRLSGVD